MTIQTTLLPDFDSAMTQARMDVRLVKCPKCGLERLSDVEQPLCNHGQGEEGYPEPLEIMVNREGEVSCAPESASDTSR